MSEYKKTEEELHYTLQKLKEINDILYYHAEKLAEALESYADAHDDLCALNCRGTECDCSWPQTAREALAEYRKAFPEKEQGE